MDIQVNVSDQRLRLENPNNFVTGTQRFVRFVFNLTSDWDVCDEIVAQFTQDGTAYNQPLDEEKAAFLPAEITQGNCTLTLRGSGESGDIVSMTDYVTLKIKTDIWKDDASSTEITQTLYDRLVTRVVQVENSISQAVDSSIEQKLMDIIDAGEDADSYDVIVLKTGTTTTKPWQSDGTNNFAANVIGHGTHPTTPLQYYVVKRGNRIYGYVQYKADAADELKVKDEVGARSAPKGRIELFDILSDYRPCKGISGSLEIPIVASYRTITSGTYVESNNNFEEHPCIGYINTGNGRCVVYSDYIGSMYDLTVRFAYDLTSNSVNTAALGETMLDLEALHELINQQYLGAVHQYDTSDYEIDYYTYFPPSDIYGMAASENYEGNICLDQTTGYIYTCESDDSGEETVYEWVRSDEPLPLLTDGFSEDIAGLATRIGDAESAISSQGGSITSLTSRMGTVEGKASANETSILSLNSTVARKGEDLIFGADGRLHMTVDGQNPIGYGVEVSTDTGLAFDEITVETDEDDGKPYLHIKNEGTDVVDPCELPQGGGGGGSASGSVKIRNLMESRVLTIRSEVTDFSILASWSSVDGDNVPIPGNGTASWYVNNVRVAMQTNVPQGNISFQIRPYLQNGEANTVKLTMEDSEGNAKSFTWTVNVSVVRLTWNLDEIAYHGQDNVIVRIRPTGAGTKHVVVTVDGTTTIYDRTFSSDENGEQMFTLPAQTHGEHVITADMTAVVGTDTIVVPTLEHTGVWTQSGHSEKIVSVHKDAIDVTQYDSVQVKYIVFDPSLSDSSASVTANLKEGNTVKSTVTIPMREMTEVHTWIYRASISGSTTLTVETGTSSNIVSDSIVITASSIGYDIQPVTTAQIMEVDPSSHSNIEQDRTSFGYTDGEGVNHPFTFSNGFDWVDGGFQQDSDGITAFVVKRGDSVTFDRSLFITNDNTNGEKGTTATGKHISIVFKTKNVTDYDTKIAHSFDGRMGIELYAHNASFQAGNKITCQYCEDYKVEMSLNIDPTNATMKFWIAGTPTNGNTFLTSGAKTRFVQDNPDNFTIGSDDCDVWIYCFRMYSAFLTDAQVLQNYTADCGTPGEMIERYLRNDIYDGGNLKINKLMIAAPDLHIITIETSEFPTDKGSAGNKNCKIIHQIGNGIAADQWYAEDAKYTLQGTSSMNYRQVAGNLDINMKKAVMKVSSTQEVLNGYAMTEDSVPVKYFNLKANVASSENANNRCAAELYNRFNPLISKAKDENPKVRDTVEGHPCAVFIKNTGNSDLLLGVEGARTIAPGETILYFAGDMNNSKKNTEVFGQTGEWDDENHEQCCIEFLENTYTRCTFKTHDFENEGWKESGTQLTSHFEFRYPEDDFTQGMKDNFIAMHAWVYSTDPEQATGALLPQAERIGAYIYDTAEYRKLKFKTQVANYFNLDNLLFYYLFTEFFLAVDNRAKNMFMSYEPDDSGNWRWNVSKFYDGDTILGIDNKGNFFNDSPNIDGDAYGFEDTDGYEETEGGVTVVHPYFNAAESVLWCNVRDCFPVELAEAYNRYESAGLFTANYLTEMFDSYQRIRPEALMIEDYSGKYDAPIENAGATQWMVNMEHGEKQLQRRQFLIYREKYMSSKYVSAKAKADEFTYQAKPGANFSSAIEMTPYSDMYVGIIRDQSPAGKTRLKKGQTAVVQCLDGNGNPFILDSGEIAISLTNGSNLKHVGGAAYLYPRQVSITSGAKLQDLLLGDSNYSSSNLSELSFTSAPLINKVDIRGQSGLSGNIDLTGCTLLEELKMTGTGQTLVHLPQTKTLRTVQLGSNVTELFARNLPSVTSFSCTPSNLATVWIEEVPAINTKTLVSNATNLTRGRIIGVDWEFPNPDVMLRLASLKGLGDSGNPLDDSWGFYLTGTVSINKLTSAEYTTICSGFTRLIELGLLDITYSSLAPAYTVTFKSENNTLNTQTVRGGDAAVDPITAGYISTPTKASTVETVYTFDGWDKSFSNITGNTVVNAVFESSTRYYTVSWKSGSTVLFSEPVAAHGTSSYYNDVEPPSGSYWLGWDKSTNGDYTNVTANTDINAIILTPSMPSGRPASFDYLYSDFAGDSCAYSLEELFWIFKNKQASTYIQAGDLLKIKTTISSITGNSSDNTIILSCAGFDHYKLSGSNQFAQTVFHMIAGLHSTRPMYNASTSPVKWRGSDIRTFLNESVYNALPRQWQLLIPDVSVRTNTGGGAGTSATIETTTDKIFLLAPAEVGLRKNDSPYTSEVDSGTATKTLPIYTNDASRAKARDNGDYGTARVWWLRSPYATQSGTFCFVGSSGTQYNDSGYDSMTADSSASIVFAFCLGAR